MVIPLSRLILYTACIMVSVLAGMGLLWRARKRRTISFSLSFSAGVFLGVTFFHIVPEVFDSLAGMAGVFFLAGFLLIYVLEKFVMVHPCEDEECETHRIGYPAFIGLSVHYFTDGIAMGSSMLLPRSELGLVVFLGILAHKAPQAFSLTSIMLKEHFRWSSILSIQTLLALLIPIGAIAAGAGINGSGVLQSMLAFSGGIFLHIALSDLLPEIHRSRDGRALHILLLVAGIGAMGLVRLLASR